MGGKVIQMESFLERIPIYKNQTHRFLNHELRQLLKVKRIITEPLVSIYYRDSTARQLMEKHPNKGNPFTWKNIRKMYRIYHLDNWEHGMFLLSKGEGKKLYTPTEEDQKRLNNFEEVYVPIKVKFDKDYRKNQNQISVTQKAKEVMHNEENHEKLFKFFESLEQYGIKFSTNQKNMLVSSRNTLVLGRSGTGKTTISAFKILALNLLYIAYKKKDFHYRSSYKLEAEDLDAYSSACTVFCTASPVLTNEVKRFYYDLIQSIKKILRAKEQKALSKEIKDKQRQDIQMDQEEQKEKSEVTHEEDATEAELSEEENSKLKGAMMHSLEKAKEGHIEDIEEDKLGNNSGNPKQNNEAQENPTTRSLNEDFNTIENEIPWNLTSRAVVYNNLKKIPKDEYPLFLTVKKLIYMLDGSCSYSFFSRDKEGSIIGMDSTNEWHNESKEGALMINRYQKDSYNFEQTIKRVEQKIFEIEDMDDDQKVRYLRSQGYNIDKADLQDFMIP